MNLTNKHGERLDFTLTPGDDGDLSLVVVGHGVTSHKERPWLVALCDELGRRGIASLRFSYAGNGASEGRYEDATISKEVADLGSVLDALPGRHVVYAGHSMGGAVGVLRAAKDDRIRALVSLAGMVHVSEFMTRMFSHLTPGADVMLDKPHCPLTQGFLDDAHAIGSVLEHGKQIRVPYLIVHGDADDIVPIQDSRDMCEATGGNPELIEFEKVDHRFTGAEAAMAESVVTWILRRLNRARRLPGG